MDARAAASSVPATPGPATRERRHELDWLRVLAVFGLIPFHVAIIFTTSPTDYVKNAQSSPLLATLASFVSFWGIPLLFLVAGASAWFALKSRTPRTYLVERVRRLLLPFVFAVLAIVPIQVYYGRLSNPSFHQSYREFYPNYLADFSIDKLAEYMGHLWFVPALLLFAAITLPLFAFLKSPSGRTLVDWLGAKSTRPGVILAFGLPLGISDMILRSRPFATLVATYVVYSDWALFIFFLIFFIYGFLLYADPRFLQAIARHGVPALILGLALWLVAQNLVGAYGRSNYEYSVNFVAAMFLRGFISWFWVVAIVALALRYLTTGSRTLTYLDDAFYPVYVLHMPVLTIIGFYVVQWPVGIWLKYPFIVAATLVVTLGIFELLIRRVNLIRLLFGLKPRAAATATHPAAAPREPYEPRAGASAAPVQRGEEQRTQQRAHADAGEHAVVESRRWPEGKSQPGNEQARAEGDAASREERGDEPGQRLVTPPRAH